MPTCGWLAGWLLSPAGVPDAAAALLALADDCGLGHLRAVALDFIVTHFDEVSKTGGELAACLLCGRTSPSGGIAQALKYPRTIETVGCSCLCWWQAGCCSQGLPGCVRPRSCHTSLAGMLDPRLQQLLSRTPCLRSCRVVRCADTRAGGYGGRGGRAAVRSHDGRAARHVRYAGHAAARA